MSSFTRRIERTQSPSRPVRQYQKPDGTWYMAISPPRKIHYMGRGSKLGVTNPKGKELLARLARDAKKENTNE